MNKVNTIALLISLVAVGIALSHGTGGKDVIKQETAYERVMRTRTLRCGYALWPLVEDIEPNTKKLTGIAPEFTAALADKLGLKIEWVEEVQWGQEPEALQTGRIDAICSGDGPWVYTSAAVLDFVEPMAYFPIYLYGRKGETRFRNLANIDSPNVTFSAMDGDISMTVAMEKYPKAHRLEVPSSGDPSLVTMNVLTGKADLVIEDAGTAERANGPNGERLERINDMPYALINNAFAVGKGQADLLIMLNQGFQLLQQTGVSDTILDKYDPEHLYFTRPIRHWETKSVAAR